MTDLTELQPDEQDLAALFRERADAVAVQTLPPMPAAQRHLSIEPDCPETHRRRDRRRFLVAIAAAAALLAVAGWTLFNGIGPQATPVDVADGGNRYAPVDELVPPVERPVLPEDELIDANPSSAEEADWWLRRWAVDRPLIVVTGAEWCPPCLTDLPTLLPNLHLVTYNNELVPILGISAAGDQVWEQVEWPFRVLELRGDRDQAGSLLPEGLDFYPAVAVWTPDGMFGESRAADGLTLDDLQTMVAAVPLQD